MRDLSHLERLVRTELTAPVLLVSGYAKAFSLFVAHLQRGSFLVSVSLRHDQINNSYIKASYRSLNIDYNKNI